MKHVSRRDTEQRPLVKGLILLRTSWFKYGQVGRQQARPRMALSRPHLARSGSDVTFRRHEAQHLPRLGLPAHGRWATLPSRFRMPAVFVATPLHATVGRVSAATEGTPAPRAPGTLRGSGHTAVIATPGTIRLNAYLASQPCSHCLGIDSRSGRKVDLDDIGVGQQHANALGVLWLIGASGQWHRHTL